MITKKIKWWVLCLALVCSVAYGAPDLVSRENLLDAIRASAFTSGGAVLNFAAYPGWDFTIDNRGIAHLDTIRDLAAGNVHRLSQGISRVEYDNVILQSQTSADRYIFRNTSDQTINNDYAVLSQQLRATGDSLMVTYNVYVNEEAAPAFVIGASFNYVLHAN